MRDPDGAAHADLALEHRHHTAVGAEHVAEAHGSEVGLRLDEGRQLQHDPLADPLGGAEHARRADGFVGRDQHELLHAVQRRALGDAQRPEHVVPHRLDGIGLEHGHMLVRGGVKHIVRAVQLEHLLEPLRVRDAADERHHFDAGVAPGHLEVREVERAFRPLEQHQALRPVGGDLARQLRADGPGPTGDEDGLAREVALHLREVELDGLAPQQVLDLDVAHLGDRGPAGEQVVERGDDLELDARLAAAVHDAPRLLGRRGTDRDHQQPDLVPLHQQRKAVGPAQDRHAVQGAAVGVGVVVDQAHHRHRGARVVQRLAQQLLAGFAGADDERPRPRRAGRPEPLAQRARREADPAREEDHQDPVEREHGARHAAQPAHGVQRDDEQRRADRHRDREIAQVAQADVTPVAAVQAEAPEDERPDGEQVGQGAGEVWPLDGGNAKVEAEPERREVGQWNEAHVHDKKQRPTAQQASRW